MFLHLRLILWKNFLTARRHWKLTLAEVLLPLSVFTMVFFVRYDISDLKKTNITSTAYSFPQEQQLLYSYLTMKIAYAPDSEWNKQLMDFVMEELQVRANDFKTFLDERALMQYYQSTTEDQVAIIVFHGDNQTQLNYSLTLLDNDVNWQTDNLFCDDDDDICLGSSNYINQGFVGLQMAIDLAFLKATMGSDFPPDLTLSLQSFPYPPHVDDSSLRRFYVEVLPLITILSFIFTHSAMLYKTVEERATGTKELLKIAGVTSRTIWIGWVLQAICTNILTILTIAVLMKVGLWGETVIEHSNGIILFSLIFLYFLASLSVCFFMSTFFNGQCIGMAISLMFCLLSYFIPIEIMEASGSQVPKTLKILFGFLPNMSLRYGYSIISSYEVNGLGVQWNNCLQSADNDLTMGEIFLILLVTTVFLIVAAMYVDRNADNNVHPGRFGIKKSLHLAAPSIKKLLKLIKIRPKQFLKDDLSKLEEGKSLIPGKAIIINGLTKVYRGNAVVDNLSFDVHKNSITMLLGQNGAGKSTVMSIIAGLIEPTSGCVIVNDENMRCSIENDRKVIGLCTQNNILYNDLTVEEHLIFFAKLKGIENPADEIYKTLYILRLTKKNNTLAQNLSGGMKRKLCLAIALIGKPKILILDEPTSGLDPESRGEIKKLLLGIRKDTTVLLTTHHMEEVEDLADYVEIIDKGKQKHSGTPLELKKKNGIGYKLKLKLNTEKLEDCKEIISKVSGNLVSQDRSIYTFNVPIGQQISAMFRDLEKLNALVVDWSLGSVKDVFLKFENDTTRKFHSEASIFETPTASTCFGRARALLQKRLFFARRRFYWYFPGFIIALTIFTTALFLTPSMRAWNLSHKGRRLDLTLEAYHNAKVYFESPCENFNFEERYEYIVEQQNGNFFHEKNVSEAIMARSVKDTEFYKKQIVAGAELTACENRLDINVRYSCYAVHSAPIALNLATNALAKTLLNGDYSITTYNVPLKIAAVSDSVSELSETVIVGQWLILVPIVMLFLTSNFIVFPFTELSTKFVQIQVVAGATPILYWFTNFLFDAIIAIVEVVALVGIAALIDHRLFNSTIYDLYEYGLITFMLTIFLVSSLPMAYIFAHGKSLAKNCAWFALVAFSLSAASTVSDITGLGYIIGKHASQWFLIICPQYGFSHWCYTFAKTHVRNFNWDHMEEKKKIHICEVEPNPCCIGDGSEKCLNYRSYFEDGYITILLTIASGILYFATIILYQKWWERRLKNRTEKDKGKKSNRTKEDNGDINDDILQVKNLSKRFGKTTRVNDLNLTVRNNECYGLLGSNGAGKTTTFQILAKNLLFDGGKIELNDKKRISISDHKYSEALAYCPQTDALNLQLTGEEILITICLLKGYSSKASKQIVTQLLQSFDLDEYAGLPSVHYSGGNKRKLCICVALIGFPKVILLDEPTSGVDPISQAHFWELMSSVKKRTSIVLSSHSMDDYEALCDTVAILKEGRIQLQDKVVDLKNRKGHKIIIQLKDNAKIEHLKNDLKVLASLENEHRTRLSYYTKETFKLSEIFDKMTDLKKKHNISIEEFAISKATLEDVLVSVEESSDRG